VARKKYQEEIGLDVVQRIWDRGFLTGFELLRIGAWKSAKSIALLTVNEEDQIELVTKVALTALNNYRSVNVVVDPIDWDDWRETVALAIGRSGSRKQPPSGLLSLHGIGYPMATAILATVAPTAFPVLDKWAISGAFDITPTEAAKSKWHRSEFYAEYCKRLATDGRHEFKDLRSVHQRDQWLMNMAMKRHARQES
jgi:hypothetical protein